MRKIVRCSILAVLAWPLAACALAPSPISWRPVDASTGQLSEVGALQALAADFPNSASVRLRLLNANLDLGAFDAVFGDIRWLSERGYQFGESARAQLLSHYEGEIADNLRATFAAYAPPLAESDLVATVPAEARLVEGIAFDTVSGEMVVSSVVSRDLWRLSEGQWKHDPIEDAGNLSGIVVDDSSGVWLASGDLGMLSGDLRAISGLVNAGREGVRTFATPGGATLSDIAIGADGAVYASDPLSGGIYRLPLGGEAIETLIAPGKLRSPQGIAPSNDASRLYLSDYRYGLGIVDVATGTVSRLPADIPVLLDGIDGLWLYQGELIAIQNGTSPMRIIALALSGDGNRITGLRVIERANPAWTEPLGGAIHEGALHYIANGQWDLFGEGGALREGAEPQPTQIRRIELGGN